MRPTRAASHDIQVRLKGAHLILSSSDRPGVYGDGPALIETVGDGVMVTERLPALELAPICRIEVPTGALVDVELEAGGLSVTRFMGTLRARLFKGSARIDDSDGRIRIVAATGSITVERVGGGVDILTGSGNVAARVIDGDLQAVTDNGSMLFERITGPLVARSTNGPIEATELTGAARLSSRSGSIRVTGASRQLKVRSQTGDITLEAAIVEHTTVETFKGNLDVRLLPGTDARLEASARQGIVRTKRIASLPGSSRRVVRGMLGGGRARLRVSTGLGVVEIAGPLSSSSPSSSPRAQLTS